MNVSCQSAWVKILYYENSSSFAGIPAQCMMPRIQKALHRLSVGTTGKNRSSAYHFTDLCAQTAQSKGILQCGCKRAIKSPFPRQESVLSECSSIRPIVKAVRPLEQCLHICA